MLHLKGKASLAVQRDRKRERERERLFGWLRFGCLVIVGEGERRGCPCFKGLVLGMVKGFVFGVLK